MIFPLSFELSTLLSLPVLCLSITRVLFVSTLQESVYERMKKTGGPNPFNLFVIAEMECMHKLLATVRETLLVNEFYFI